MNDFHSQEHAMILGDFKQCRKLCPTSKRYQTNLGRALTKETVPDGATNQASTGCENDAASGEFVDGARTEGRARASAQVVGGRVVGPR